VIRPLLAFLGTTATIRVAEWRLILPRTPAKLTWLTPRRFVPLIVTVLPATARRGLKPVMRGWGWKLALLALPPLLLIVIGPAGAVGGTIACSSVAERTWKLVAATPAKLTSLIPRRFVPVMVTVAPAGALVGLTLVIRGWGWKLA